METETTTAQSIDLFDTEAIGLDTSHFVISFICVLIIIAECFVIRWFFRKIVKRYETRGEQTGKSFASQITVAHLISSIIKAVAIVVGVIFILQFNGVKVTGLITSVSIISAIIGLALQDVIKDIVQGINIISEHYFNVGDVISYQGIDGKVTQISLRSTKIMDIKTHDVLTISNRNISQITNKSHLHDINLNLSYEEDPEKIRALLTEIAEKIGNVEGVEYCVFKGTQEFGDSAVVYKLRMFTKPAELPELHRKAMMIIQDELGRAGVEIPYMQLDIHQKG